MSKGYFITGTDTGVGKTLVAGGLAALCKNKGLNVGVMKPVATGCKRVNNTLISDDTFDSGSVGIWTKSDSYTLFDDLVMQEFK